MTSDVKSHSSKRRYDGSNRRNAAEENRRSILAAARQLFVERGYAGTTMSAVAAAAGVALDTVYAAVGAKPALLRELIETAISGSDHAIPAEQRHYVKAIVNEPDPHRKLRMYARSVAEIQPRLAPLFLVLRDAARSDPDLANLWNDISNRRAANMRLLVGNVAQAGGLRAGVSTEDAADLIWATNGPEFFLLLTAERGWTAEKFEEWLGDLWTRSLLPE